MQQYEDECYDITQAISRIEEELIASFMRNFEKHKAEETELGYNWSAWQVEMMKSLEGYSRENRKKYPKLFRKLNDRIDALIDMAREEGQGDEEARILEAIRRGIHIEKASDSLTGSFFALNDKKIDALKNSVRNDMEKAEYATLRRVDDVYRRTIFDAQVYASTGAGTYEKAVDMAVKDFLSKGIDSIEYKNGARHNISDYADMAIRTASKRAYLTGEGEKRAQYGEHLVIVNRRGAGDSHSGSSVCGHCAKWAGKVLIDDVWSGGSKADGDYPLMSQAIADGLYHPRCKDSHTTYFDDGFDAEYDKEKQAEEQKKIVEEHNAEEKIKYAERQFEKYDRLARYALDDEDRRTFEIKADEWQQRYRKVEIIPGSDMTKTRRGCTINAKKVKTIHYENVYVSDNVKLKPRLLHNVDYGIAKCMKDITKDMTDYEKPIVVIVEDNLMSSADRVVLAAYNPQENTVYVSSAYDSTKKASGWQENYHAAQDNKLSTFYHELLHWKDAQQYIKKYGKIEDQRAYFKWIDAKSKKMLDKLAEKGYNIYDISGYATECMGRMYDEVYTEYRVKKWSEGL